MKTTDWNCLIGEQEVTISCGTVWNSTSYYLYVNNDFLEEIPRKTFQDMCGGIDHEIEVYGEKLRFLVRSEVFSLIQDHKILPPLTGRSTLKTYKPLLQIPVWLARLYTISCLPLLAFDYGFIILLVVSLIWFTILYSIKPTFKYSIPVLLTYIIVMWSMYIGVFLNRFYC